MKIYNGSFSANTLRVWAVALELGLDAETVEINVMGGENKSDDYRTINPNWKVPALGDDGVII
ncbi:glutathione S-transferase family protein [Loktanella agnita]|uniref:glutathione S-transferase family protein n=1 Tax=Loktanella agnita TaxID=287097 RepID=UPI0039871072